MGRASAMVVSGLSFYRHNYQQVGVGPAYSEVDQISYHGAWRVWGRRKVDRSNELWLV